MAAGHVGCRGRDAEPGQARQQLTTRWGERIATFADAVAQLEAILVATDPAAAAASGEMSDLFKGAVQRELRARSHPFATKTPSPPGSPPAMISGDLADTILNEPPHEDGPAIWVSRSGPTVRYARIQELGGEMHGHPTMHWWQDGVPFWSHAHSLPPRPYMKPVARRLSDDSEMREVAGAAFGAVIDAAGG